MVQRNDLHLSASSFKYLDSVESALICIRMQMKASRVYHMKIFQMRLYKLNFPLLTRQQSHSISNEINRCGQIIAHIFACTI